MANTQVIFLKVNDRYSKLHFTKVNKITNLMILKDGIRSDLYSNNGLQLFILHFNDLGCPLGVNLGVCNHSPYHLSHAQHLNTKQYQVLMCALSLSLSVNDGNLYMKISILSNLLFLLQIFLHLQRFPSCYVPGHLYGTQSPPLLASLRPRMGRCWEYSHGPFD